MAVLITTARDLEQAKDGEILIYRCSQSGSNASGFIQREFLDIKKVFQ